MKTLQNFSFKKSYPVIIWFLLSLIALIIQISKGSPGYNNYLIFKGVFYHTLEQTNLFLKYPGQYNDSNHYGPFFSIVIAPFALLPDVLGCLLWGIANAIFLFYAISKLPVSDKNKNLILLIGSVEMMTTMHNVQFNPSLTASVLMAYILVKDGKNFWATFFIAFGIMVKIYGIVGLAFFIFSQNKPAFIASFIFWMAVMFCLPMIISSPQFIIQSYKDWYVSLSEKNNQNQESMMQGMSAMRVLKKLFQLSFLKDIWILAVAAVMYLIPFLRFKQLKEHQFQLFYVAMLLIGIVIFSSSAESATYIIAMIGVGIWFVNEEPKNNLIYFLLFFAIIFTSFATTDLFPRSFRDSYVRPYGLKALPCFLIWLWLFYRLTFTNFIKTKISSQNV